MTSSISIKPNPFQRSNPFQVQSTYQSSSITSFTSYPPKSTYRPTDKPESLLQKQNSFYKKTEPQIWKFRQDNCGKVKGFSHQTNSILHEKYLTERNSFQKELVLSSVARRKNQHGNEHNVNHNSGQEMIDKGPIDNPFGRKYLISGNTLAESQVYAGFKSSLPTQQNLPAYEKYKSEYDVYTPQTPLEPLNIYSYGNYQPVPIQDNYTAPVIPSVGSNHNLETSLYHKNSQYASRKSIERADSQNRNSSYNHMNAVESRYSLEREKQNKDKYNSIGSNRDLYQGYGTESGYAGGKAYSKSNIPLAERDRDSRVYSRASVKQENVKFEQSDDEEQKAQRSHQTQKHRQPTFGSKRQVLALQGPHEITIRGMKFYKRPVLSY